MTEDNPTKLHVAWKHPESSYTPPEDDCGSVCIHCQIDALVEAQENLSAEIYDLQQSIQHLVRMLGGK